MSHVLGLNCLLQYKSGGAASGGAWTTIGKARDVRMPLSWEEADLTCRDTGGNRALVPTLTAIEITFDMVYDSADAAFTALLTAALAKTAIGIRCLKGPTPSHGLTADMFVFGLEEGQELVEGVVINFTLKVGFSAFVATYGAVAS